MRATTIVRITVTLAAAGLVMAAPANAEPRTDTATASCGISGPNLENRVEGDAPAGGAANQRSGPSQGCAIPGVLQPTDDARYFCYLDEPVGSGSNVTWTYLQNLRTGVRGWVRDDLLDLNADHISRGSLWYCNP